MGISDKDSMGTPRPENDQRGNDDWFNRHGFKRWDKPPGSGRKPIFETRKIFRNFSLTTIITLLIVIMTGVFFITVFRDRRALEHARHEAERRMDLQTYDPGVGTKPGTAPAYPPSLGAMAGTTAAPESIVTSEVVFRKASPSVVTVKIFSGADKRLLVQGSGVVVGPGTVATNRHVVESGSEIRVIYQGQTYPASVMYADRDYDLCALGVPSLPAPQVDMASVQTIRVGQRVYAIGAPRGLELSISDGLISSIRPFGAFPLIQTNAPISKGSSGGGLFDTDGRLVGITTSSAIDGQNINFALVADLISLLPTRSADIGTLKPIVPMQRADDINNKALLDVLQERKQAIVVREAELQVMGEEINRYTFTLNELKQSMDGFLSSRNTKAYNDMVPRYNQIIGFRSELANRFQQKRQAYVVLVEQHNQMAEQYRKQGYLQ
ncbi:MAG: serine protease [Deltaproteobacteria bacterium]|nr:MAG: serine protease [Deltaproteobacteria bacterium]